MGVFVVRRLAVSSLILIASTFLMFALVSASGDPLGDLRLDTSPNKQQKIEQRIEQLHLDKSLPQRYLIWAGGAVKCVVPGQECDLGTTIRGQEVTALLSSAIVVTLRLVTAALVFAILLGVTVGIVSSLRQYSGFDYTITFSAFLFFSLPIFWVAVLLKQYLAIDVNNWYADPTISLGVAAVLSVLSGITWGAIVGGDRQRKWIVRGAAAVLSFAILLYLEAVDWFTRPALGPLLITVFALGTAVVVTALVAGLNRRNVLYACLVTAGIGALAQFVVTPWLENAQMGVVDEHPPARGRRGGGRRGRRLPHGRPRPPAGHPGHDPHRAGHRLLHDRRLAAPGGPRVLRHRGRPPPGHDRDRRRRTSRAPSGSSSWTP